jgi:hypothetical protein
MTAGLVASDIYPAVRRFLLESGLAATLVKFDKETSTGDEAQVVDKARRKRVKKIAKIELTAACQSAINAADGLVFADIYPAVRRFLLESGLSKTLKAFDKETINGEEAEVVDKARRKRAKKISTIELTAACQLALGGAATNGDATNGVAAAAEEDAPKAKKRKLEEVAEAEPEPAKKQKTEVASVAPEVSKKKDKKLEQKSSGVPFSRVDDSKWRATITDSRLIDNTHLAKQKFGGDVGDTWADRASEDLLKVKGKGFRKEMAKKKRASWRGGGMIDQGVNSIKFDDWSEGDDDL